MTEEIMTTDNNQKISVYCRTCVCKSCEQLKRLEQENEMLTRENENRNDWIISLNKKCEELIDAKTRLEQENKHYKQLLQGCPADGDDCGFCEIDKRNKELEQENKELKEEINKLGKKHEDYCNTMYWQMKEQMDKYRSALEEINLILDELKQQYDYMTDYSEIKEIQEKINEVLGNESDKDIRKSK